MKKLLLLTLSMLTVAFLFAQKDANQNPNYQISRTRYMGLRDSLLITQATTVQNTYQAYDWMAVKQERKDIRFLNRQQRRLNRSQYGGGWYNTYPYGNYNQPYYNNGFYNGGYINGGYYRSSYGNGNYYYNRYRPNFWWSFLF